MSKQRASIIAILLATIVFLLDFGTKYYVSYHLPLLGPQHMWFPYGGIEVFRNFFGVDFSIVHAINLGAAWGIFSQYQGYLLVGRILLIIGVAVYALFFNKNRNYDIPLALIIAGATANVVDYFIYGHVVDMFYFIFWGYHYPVFNVADSAICVGVAWLIFSPKESQEVGEDVT
jgi:signal peptidase II